MTSTHEQFLDELLKSAPPEGTPEYDDYLQTVNLIRLLQVDIDKDVHNIRLLQSQIAQFDPEASFTALAVMCEELATLVRLAGQHQNDVQGLLSKLERLQS